MCCSGIKTYYAGFKELFEFYARACAPHGHVALNFDSSITQQSRSIADDVGDVEILNHKHWMEIFGNLTPGTTVRIVLSLLAGLLLCPLITLTVLYSLITCYTHSLH